MPARRELQLFGEDAAARFCEAQGWRLAARNWRTALGEIDIVAYDGATLVFVEVKTRSPGSLYEPSLAVDHQKQRRLRRLAGAYIALERPRFGDCRFDVISVVPSGEGPLINHIPEAF